MKTKVDIPDSEALIAVYGARCAGCGHVIPDDNDKVGPDALARLREDVDAQWRSSGMEQWRQTGWPRYYPPWMVRKGFRCPFCLAPDLLVAFTPGDAQ